MVRYSADITDRSLIESAQQGDRAAFGEIVRRHQPRLYRTLTALVKDRATAEDMAQEAFVRAWEQIKRFRVEYDFYPWLATIARNLSYTHLAREERRSEQVGSLDKLQESGHDPQSQELGPLEQLLAGEGDKRFYAALMSMPESFRVVFVLRHFEGLDYHEIASYLKIPPGTVDSRLYRARKYLLDACQELLGD